MSDARPMLSVIVTMHQSVATVGHALRAPLADEVAGGLEVIVVDDGSTDGGARVVGEFVRKDRRVRLVNRAHGGAAAARNTGIGHARGTWLRFMNADDAGTAGSAAGLIACATGRVFAGACGAHALIDEGGEPMGRICPAKGGAAVDGAIGIDEFLAGNRCGMGTVVIRADALGRQRFDESLRVCEDWDLWLRLTGHGARLAVRAGSATMLHRVRRARPGKDFGAMLRAGQDVLRRAFVRERARGMVGLNVSLERERSAMAEIALEWATMRALGEEEGGLAAAVEMFGDGGGAAFDGAQAAHAAHWAALLGLGIRPEAATDERRRWLAHVKAWWASCAEHGWMAAGEIERAWDALAVLAAPPEEIARACVAEAMGRGMKGLVVVGLGVNGRALTDAAMGLGVPVTARDDRADVSEMAAMEPMDAPVQSDRAVVITPAADRPLVERFGGANPIRWIVVRQRLAAHMRSSMHDEAGSVRVRPLRMSRPSGAPESGKRSTP